MGRAVRQQIQGALDPLQFAYRAGRGVEDASDAAEQLVSSPSGPTNSCQTSVH